MKEADLYMHLVFFLFLALLDFLFSFSPFLLFPRMYCYPQRVCACVSNGLEVGKGGGAVGLGWRLIFPNCLFPSLFVWLSNCIARVRMAFVKRESILAFWKYPVHLWLGFSFGFLLPSFEA